MFLEEHRFVQKGEHNLLEPWYIWSLHAIRWAGVFLATSTFVVELVGPKPADYTGIPTGRLVVFGFLLLYHILATGVCQKFLRTPFFYGLILTDLVFGGALIYLQGKAHLVHGILLPAVEVSLLWGTLAGAALLAIETLGVLSIRTKGVVETLSSLVLNGEDETVNLINQQSLGYYREVLSQHCTYLVWIAIAYAFYRLTVHYFHQYSALVSEFDIVFEHLEQELETRKKEVGQVYCQVGERDALTDELKHRLDTLEQELQNSKQDLALSRRDALQREQELQSEYTRESQYQLEQIQEKEKHLESRAKLLQLFQQVLPSSDLHTVFTSIFSGLDELVPTPNIIFFQTRENNGLLELSPQYIQSVNPESLDGLVFSSGEGSVGYVMATGRPLLIEGGTVALEGRQVSVLPGQGQSAYIVSIVFEEVLGVLYLGRLKAQAFSGEEMDLVDDFARLASVKLKTALDYYEVKEKGVEDPVSGVYNKIYLRERTEEEVRRGRRYAYPSSLLYVHIDYLESILTKIDVAERKKLFRQMARVLLDAVRETDVVARFDNGLFGILLVHTDRDAAVMIGNRIVKSTRETPFELSGKQGNLTVSVGVAGLPHDGSNVNQLTSRALGALKKAQQEGGNCASVY